MTLFMHEIKLFYTKKLKKKVICLGIIKKNTIFALIKPKKKV